MSGDYSRFIFDPTLDYHGVQLQQGRPLTDWDWNDATAQINRRQQVDSYDTLGQAVVPLTTKDAFAIQLAGGSFNIGPGRMYVDGLLAENHGTGAQTWDPALAELVGTGWVPYDQQPYYPNAPALPAPGGLNLVYLDVWQREVSWIEAPDLVEPALGLDTTTRIQTVWQVKLLANVDSGTTCATSLDQVKGWSDLTAPSAGLLTTATGAPTSNDPCQIPPAGGYKGLENQLYRIEIHGDGAVGKASFKWSRNNASIVANVTKLIDTKTLVVDSVGRDSVLRFNDGDWVEITDDWRELNNQPGEMHQIAIGGGVDDATRTITLTSPINASWFPSGTLQARHTRLKRWDQQGKILNADGTLCIDLDTTADGLIPVPKAGKQLVLESGILVGFDVSVSGGKFKSGDYWVFAARAATADIDHLTKAPPRGIHHHYAKLGYTTLSGTPQDCRVFWPPAAGGDSCSCTMCVTPAGHNGGTATIQQAISFVIKNGGGTVCLEPGTYNVSTTLNITGAASLRIRGQGPATLLAATTATAILIDNSGDIGLSDFSLQLNGTATTGGAAASIGLSVNAAGTLDVQQLLIVSGGTGTPADTAIQLGGSLDVAAFSRCGIATATGIAAISNLQTGGGYSGSVLRILENTFDCATAAVNAPQIMSPGELFVQCRGNSVRSCSDAGFRFGTGDDTQGRIELTDNRLLVGGFGIIGTISSLDIRNNEIHYQQATEGAKPLFSAITIGDPANIAKITITDVHVSGNRISDFGGAAITSVVPLDNAMVSSNQIDNVGLGIALVADTGGAISVENNQISQITGYALGDNGYALGIMVAGGSAVHIGGNSLADIGSTLSGSVYAFGIYAMNGNQIAVHRNSIVNLTPQANFKGEGIGVMIQNGFVDASVLDNHISRSAAAPSIDSSMWYAIAIAGFPPAVLTRTGVGGLNHATTKKKKAAAPARATTLNAASKKLLANAPKVDTTRLAKVMGISKSRLNFAAPADTTVQPYQRAMVRGNQLSGYGGTPIVQIASGNECDFSGNQCLATPAPNVEAGAPEVVIGATALTINGNRVNGTPLSIALLTPATVAAVAANITKGAIELNSASLDPAWQALNLGGF